MTNNLHISYDLFKEGQNYPAVAKRIQELGKAIKIQYSFWYVRSEYTAEQAINHIMQALDKNDTLYVVDSTNNDAHAFNLKPEVEKFIQQNWDR